MCKEFKEAAHAIETIIDYLMINRYEFPESQEYPMDDIAKISSRLGISNNCAHTMNNDILEIGGCRIKPEHIKGRTENLVITCIDGECKIKCLLCGKIIDAQSPTDDELEKARQRVMPELDDDCRASMIRIIETWYKWKNHRKNRKREHQKSRVAFTIRHVEK